MAVWTRRSAVQLKEHNIRIENFDNVTGTQLVVVKTVLDGTESNASKAAQIERIFAYKRPVAGGEYLRRDAAECIRQVGADIDVNDLTPDEMLQIQLIVGSDDDVGTKKARIEALAND